MEGRNLTINELRRSKKHWHLYCTQISVKRMSPNSTSPFTVSHCDLVFTIPGDILFQYHHDLLQRLQKLIHNTESIKMVWYSIFIYVTNLQNNVCLLFFIIYIYIKPTI